MRAVETKDARGSLHWIRTFVNERTDVLDQAVRSACQFDRGVAIDWVSPLANDEFAEYRDQDFLERLNVSLPVVSLKEYWPNMGPQWDALARTSEGAILLVEAKANVPEIVSPGTGASADSRQLIEQSLSATKAYLGVKSDILWSGKLYQYANRIAHLYLMRELNKIPTYMVFIYFIGDKNVNGPESVEEWKAAITVAKRVLGLSGKSKLAKYIADVYIDVRNVTAVR